MTLQLKCNYIKLDNFKVIDVHEDKKWEKEDFPHFHYFLEIKFYKDNFGNYACTIVLPEVVHRTTFNKCFDEGWSLVLEKPDVMLMSFYKQDNNMHILSFEKLNSICPGNLMNLVNKLVEILRMPVSHVNIEKMINALLGVLTNSINIALELIQKNNSGIESLAEKAQKYIEHYYYHDDLTVLQVAKHLGVSGGHLAHVFKDKNMGTIKAYIVKCRLNNALNLLKSKRYSVKEVAMMTGWNCQFYFSNCFRNHYGIPPSSSSKLPNVVYHLNPQKNKIKNTDQKK